MKSQLLSFVCLGVICLLCYGCPPPITPELRENVVLRDSADIIYRRAAIGIASDSIARLHLSEIENLYLAIPKSNGSKMLDFARKLDSVQALHMGLIVSHGVVSAPIPDLALQKRIAEHNSLVAENKRHLADIKKRLIEERDDFSGITYYWHRHWGKKWPRRKALMAVADSKSGARLVSNYYADDWIFHTWVQVLVGDDKYESDVVLKHDANNRTEISGGVFENITYNADGGILQAIAQSGNKVVKVRFVGDQYHADIVLSAGDKAAFRDVWAWAHP